MKKTLLFIAVAGIIASCTKKSTDMPKHDYRCYYSTDTYLYRAEADFRTDSSRVAGLGSNAAIGHLNEQHADTFYRVDTAYIQQISKNPNPARKIYIYSDTIIAMDILPRPNCQRL
jgi:hypothetical protein